MFPYTIDTPNDVFISRLIWDTTEDGEAVRFWYDGLYYLLEYSYDPYQRFEDATEYFGTLSRDRGDGYFGDRQEGTLYGPAEEHDQIFTDETEAENLYSSLREIWFHPQGGQLVEEVDIEDYEWDEDDNVIKWRVWWSERPILANGIWTNWNNRYDEWPYWIPNENVAEPAELPETADEEAMQNFIRILTVDWRTLEGYGHDWTMVVVNATVYADPEYEEEIGESVSYSIEKVMGYVPSDIQNLLVTHRWFDLPEEQRKKISSYGSYNITDQAFYETLAEAAYEAASQVGVLYDRELSEWPSQLVWLRDVLVWIGQQCNFARTDVLNPTDLEEVDPGTYQISVEMVCRSNLADMQRKITTELIPQLSGYLEAATEIGREGDAVVLTLLVRDIRNDANYEIIMEISDERIFLGPYEVEIPVPERKEPLTIRASHPIEERGGYSSHR